MNDHSRCTAGKLGAARHVFAGGRFTIRLTADVHLDAGQTLEVPAG
jgi:hypothetical protein